MFAMLRAVARFNRDNDDPIRSVLCPGLGTGIGCMSPENAAQQMALAYRNFLSPPESVDWEMAQLRELMIYGGSDSA